MACSSCGTAGCATKESAGSTTKSKGCGSEGKSGCTRHNSFDWLAGMDITLADPFNIVEIKFKGGRKEFFRNSAKLELTTGDVVVVEVANGHHMGEVALQGELVRLQMRRKNVVDNEEIKQIYRLANPRDVEKYQQARQREQNTLFRTKQIVQELKLEMKMSDVEYQADNTKATFYYSAEDRVDFRELIKRLASEFKIRVEMKQISLRHEAARLGGIGVCGRELCCSTWLTDFKSVATSAARYQNLSLNPTKLSGQCGRLKCCLNYELDTYMDALKGIPEVEVPLLTEHGEARLQKTDIFKRIMWFAYRDDESTWHPLSVDRVTEIIEMNKQQKRPASLTEDTIIAKEETVAFQKEKQELSRFDDKFGKRKKKKKKKSGSGQANTSQTQGTTDQQKQEGQKQQGQQKQHNNPQHQQRHKNNPNNKQRNNNPKPNTQNNADTQGQEGQNNQNKNNSNNNNNPNRNRNRHHRHRNQQRDPKNKPDKE